LISSGKQLRKNATCKRKIGGCCLTGDLQNTDRAGGECERAGLQEFHTSQAGEKVSVKVNL
jgi:hypothetical protein